MSKHVSKAKIRKEERRRFEAKAKRDKAAQKARETK